MQAPHHDLSKKLLDIEYMFSYMLILAQYLRSRVTRLCQCWSLVFAMAVCAFIGQELVFLISTVVMLPTAELKALKNYSANLGLSVFRWVLCIPQGFEPHADSVGPNSVWDDPILASHRGLKCPPPLLMLVKSWSKATFAVWVWLASEIVYEISFTFLSCWYQFKSNAGGKSEEKREGQGKQCRQGRHAEQAEDHREGSRRWALCNGRQRRRWQEDGPEERAVTCRHVCGASGIGKDNHMFKIRSILQEEEFQDSPGLCRYIPCWYIFSSVQLPFS